MPKPDPFDDLPDVPDVPEEPESPGALAPGDDDAAIRQIRRRVTPFGWLVILSVIVSLGGVGYFLVQTAIRDAREEDERQRGRLELAQILQRNLPPAEAATQVRAAYARTTSEDVRRSARRILAGLRDPQAVPLLIEGLSITTGTEADISRARAESALGLVEVGLPHAESAKPRLLAVLPRTDPNIDQVPVAWALTALGEAGAWPQVRRLLEANQLQTAVDLTGRRLFDPALVARMAGKDRLIELSRSQSVTSRRLAALSLGELATPDVLDALLLLVRDSDENVAREAAIGLGRTGSPRAAEPVVAFLNTHPDMRDSVLAALAANSGAPGLAVVIHGARDLTTRAEATRLLRDLRDPDGGDALFEAMSAATGTEPAAVAMKRNATFGLAEIGDARAVDGLLAYAQYATTHFDPNSTQEAKMALDQIRNIPGAAARAKAGLLALLRDPHGDFVRTPVLLALAAAGDPSLGAELMPFLAQPDAQEGAAVAVCALRFAPGVARVRSQLRRPPNLNMSEETVRDEAVFITRRNAIRGAAWSGDVAIAQDLMRIIDDAQDRQLLREEAGFALASLADDALLTQIADRATDTARPPDARLYYVFALRGRSTPAIANRLVQAYLRPGVEPGLLRAAAIAAGFGADPSTAALLAPLVASTDGNVRFAAGVATVLGGDARAAGALLDALVTNEELAGTLQNEFAPRSANPHAATQQENWLLLPLTQAMFDDGRVYRRVETVTLLEQGRGNRHFSWGLTQLTGRLKSGWENALGVGPHAIRRELRRAAVGSDSYKQDMAFRALRALNDRGSLLALRRQTASPTASERARRELLEMATSGGGSGGAS